MTNPPSTNVTINMRNRRYVNCRVPPKPYTNDYLEMYGGKGKTFGKVKATAMNSFSYNITGVKSFIYNGVNDSTQNNMLDIYDYTFSNNGIYFNGIWHWWTIKNINPVIPATYNLQVYKFVQNYSGGLTTKPLNQMQTYEFDFIRYYTPGKAQPYWSYTLVSNGPNGALSMFINAGYNFGAGLDNCLAITEINENGLNTNLAFYLGDTITGPLPSPGAIFNPEHNCIYLNGYYYFCYRNDVARKISVIKFRPVPYDIDINYDYDHDAHLLVWDFNIKNIDFNDTTINDFVYNEPNINIAATDNSFIIRTFADSFTGWGFVELDPECQFYDLYSSVGNSAFYNIVYELNEWMAKDNFDDSNPLIYAISYNDTIYENGTWFLNLPFSKIRARIPLECGNYCIPLINRKAQINVRN